MAEIPNARRVYYKVTGCILESHHKPDIEKAMIEFAKLHVEQALKEASEKATWKHESFDTYFGDSRDFDFIDTDGAGDPSTGHNVFVDKDSILNSYSLDNIK
jgi:hypothetical protein